MRRSPSCVSLKLASTQISLSERIAMRPWPTWTLSPGLTFRRVGHEPSEGAIDVAFFFEPVEHLLRRLLERMDDPKLSRALDHTRLRLKNGRKGLIEIGRDLAEISPVGLRRQSQGGADLTGISKRRTSVRAGRQQGGLS